MTTSDTFESPGNYSVVAQVSDQYYVTSYQFPVFEVLARPVETNSSTVIPVDDDHEYDNDDE